jgi:DUF4097 and DUF4098 domain-containing protein YvlB
MSEEKKLILEMLREGKISAEEAQKLLEAVGSDESRAESRPRRPDRPPESHSVVGDIFDTIRTSLSNLSFNFDFGDSNRISLEERFTGHFAEGPVELELHSRNGSIKIESWNEPSYQLDIVKRVRANTREEAEEIASAYQFAQASGSLLRAGDFEAKAGGNRISVSMLLRLPRKHGYHGLVKTMNGSIEAVGLDTGRLALSSMNGSIQLREVNADEISAQTVNGSLKLDGSLSSVQGSTTNGSVTLVNMAVSSLNKVETVNGRIQIQLPVRGDIGYSVDARTTAGSIRTDHPALSVMRDERRTVGRRLEARSANWSSAHHLIELKLKSVNGSIKILELE